MGKDALDDAGHAIGCNALKRLIDIEKRGHIIVDRHTGMLQVVGKSLDFAATKPSPQPVVEFKERDMALQCLDDIKETWSLFDCPVNIELLVAPGKGKPDFWEKVASLRAEFLRTELARRGVPEKLIVFNGQPAKEPSLAVQLMVDVFKPLDAADAARG